MAFTRSEIEAIEVGTTKIARVSGDRESTPEPVISIHARQEDIHGRLFICGYTAFGDNNAGLSFSIKEGDVLDGKLYRLSTGRSTGSSTKIKLVDDPKPLSRFICANNPHWAAIYNCPNLVMPNWLPNKTNVPLKTDLGYDVLKWLAANMQGRWTFWERGSGEVLGFEREEDAVIFKVAFSDLVDTQ